MNHLDNRHPADSSLSPRDVLRLLRNRRRTWLLPTVLLTVLAALFALVKTRQWEARQALFVRQEAAGTPERSGRFGDLSEMKKLQETILELARSRRVLGEALRQAGPPSGEASDHWPTNDQVEALRDRLTITPPKGAEFGSTEVFYLVIKDDDRDRAVELVGAVCDQLEHRLQRLRDAKARSLVDELARSVELANKALSEDTARLTNFEQTVGADLSELRMLHGSSSGNSDFRQQTVYTENEIRRYETDFSRDQQLLKFLETAQQDPASLIASPNSLLNSQPALRSLKNGLVEAQLKTSQLQGSMTDLHPTVQAALESEREIRDNLHKELELAIAGVKVDLKLGAERIAQLRGGLEAIHAKLERLAGLRAEYGNLVSAVENRVSQLQASQTELAEAEAQSAASETASLITRIDTPEGGTHPVGPGLALITLTGAVGGLLAGLGLVFLTTGPSSPGRSDELDFQSAPLRDWETVSAEPDFNTQAGASAVAKTSQGF